MVHWSAIAGTSDQEMSRITEAAADELRTLPGVANVGGHIGRAITSDQVGDVSSGELWVTVAPDASYADTAAAVDRVIAGYAGLTSKVSTYPQERIDQIREEADSGFAVRVFGLDPAILRQKAAEVQTILEHTAGVANPHVDLPAEQPIAEVKVDLAAAQKAGVVPGDVRRAAAALLQGIEVGNLYEQQKVFSVIVKGAAATRSSLDSVRNLIIDTPNGGHARLGDVAQVTMVGNESVILHDDTSRRIDVKADIQGRPLGDIQRDINAALQQMQFPMSYHAEILTQYAQQQSNYQWLWLLAAVAAAGILVLLQTATGSWRLAAPLFLGLILALSGGVLAAQATGRRQRAGRPGRLRRSPGYRRPRRPPAGRPRTGPAGNRCCGALARAGGPRKQGEAGTRPDVDRDHGPGAVAPGPAGRRRRSGNHPAAGRDHLGRPADNFLLHPVCRARCAASVRAAAGTRRAGRPGHRCTN